MKKNGESFYIFNAKNYLFNPTDKLKFADKVKKREEVYKKFEKN
jgi:hypothetical protein